MTENTDPAEIAANNLGRDLLGAMVDELERAAAKPWSAMPEHDQQLAITRMRDRVKQLVGQTMRVLFAGDYPAVPATLDRVGVSGSIKLSMSVAKGAENRHELMDRVGQNVVILMADAEAYLEEIEGIRAQSKQADFFKPQVDLESDLGVDGSEPPADEPEPEEPLEIDPNTLDINWVRTGNNPRLERNVVTGLERLSVTALGEDLIDKLSSFNLRTDRQSVGYLVERIRERTRHEVLMALLWIDAYDSDEGTEVPCPDFLQQHPR